MIISTKRLDKAAEEIYRRIESQDDSIYWLNCINDLIINMPNLHAESSENRQIPLYVCEAYVKKSVCSVVTKSQKAIKLLQTKLTFEDFKERLKQHEFREIIFLILPGLCRSEEFIKNKLKNNRDKNIFLKVILDQLNCK